LALLALGVMGLRPAAAEEEAHLDVQLKVVDGRFAVDAARTSLRFSEPVATDYRLPKEAVRARLVATLDRLLAKTDKILALDGAQCSPADPDNQDVCNIPDASWDQAVSRFETWVLKHKPDYFTPSTYLPDILTSEFLGGATGAPKLQPLLGPTALLLADDQPGADLGRLDFVVRPPIQDRQIKACEKPDGDCVIVLQTNAGAFEGQVSRGAMARSLEPLRGEVWDLDRIHRQLGDVLALAGFPTTAPGSASELGAVTLAGAETGVKVMVDGPAAVSTIQFAFKPGGDPAAERDQMLKVLYLLLAEADFRKLKAHPDWLPPSDGQFASGDPARFYILRFPDGPAQGALSTPYSNAMRRRLTAITPLGFQAGIFIDGAPPDAGAGVTWVRFQIMPSSDTEQGSNGDKPAAAPSATPAASQPAASKPTPVPGAPRHSLKVGGGAQPHRPAEAFVEYAQSQLVGDDAVTLHAGVRGKPIIRVRYDKDFLGFAGLVRRLTVSLQGASDYTPGVPDGAVRADERRSGGGVTATLELFRDLGGQALRLSGAFGYEDVSLDAPAGAPADTEEHISHMTLGASYAFASDALNVPAVSLEPSLTAAWGGGSTPTNWKGSLSGVVHDAFESFFEFDARLAVDWASGRTPLTELPRLGGEESLRGLRPDAAAAKFAWSAQNEIWIPLRFTDRFGPAVDTPLRNGLKLAAFVDVGGVSDNLQGLPSFNAGVGLGLRYKLQQNAALRLDWAHRLTRAPRGMADQAVYFSIVLLPVSD
jgi:hypothetical protein